VQAAARHSHSREVLAASGVSPARTMKGVELSLLPPQVAATLTLEEEVRELERQVCTLFAFADARLPRQTRIRG
jgi:hypothetical protein